MYVISAVEATPNFFSYPSVVHLDLSSQFYPYMTQIRTYDGSVFTDRIVAARENGENIYFEWKDLDGVIHQNPILMGSVRQTDDGDLVNLVILA